MKIIDFILFIMVIGFAGLGNTPHNRAVAGEAEDWIRLSEASYLHQFEPNLTSIDSRLVDADPCADNDTTTTCPIHLLVLDNPIDVEGDPNSEINSESAVGITQIQLALQDLSLVRTVSLPVKVHVSGTLFQAHTAHHHTRIIMTVQSLTPQ